MGIVYVFVLRHSLMCTVQGIYDGNETCINDVLSHLETA